MLTTLALLLAQSHLPQSTFPPPPGGAVDRLGVRVAIDDDRALVGLVRSGQGEVWSYRRDGLDWTVEARLPGAAIGQASSQRFALGLDGDDALVGRPAAAYHFDGAQWNVVQSMPTYHFYDVDLESGTGAGFRDLTKTHTAIFERTPAGTWQIAPSSFSIFNSPPSVTDVAVEGETVVFGEGTWDSCSHAGYGGRVTIVERSPTGAWPMTARFEQITCANVNLGMHVDIDGDRVVASRQLPEGVAVYQRNGAGGWSGPSMILAPVGTSLSLFTGPLIADEGSIYTPLEYGAGEAVTLARWTQAGGPWSVVDEWPLESWEGPIFSSWVPICSQIDLWEGATEGLRGIALPTFDRSTFTSSIQVFEPVVSAPTCPGRPTSSGAPAHLEMVGSFRRGDEATAFVATGLPAGMLVLPLFSASPGFAPNPGGSAGDLCLGQPFTRLQHHAGAASSEGTFTFALDFDALDLSGVAIGTPTYFQAWFRDTAGAVATSNFTNGVLLRMW